MQSDNRSHRVVHAEAADAETLATVLSRAFHDEEITTWVFPNPATRRARTRPFFYIFVHDMLRHGEVYTTAARSGAALWVRPGNRHGGLLHRIWLYAYLGLTLRARGLGIGAAMDDVEERRPKEPHWYLWFLGTDPDHQGRGVGTALMQPALQRCEREGLPAWLMTATERNVAWYQRFGFVATESWELDQGPRVWTMLRPRP